jgi:RNA polymerase sigma-70 factor, ECF subfamily
MSPAATPAVPETLQAISPAALMALRADLLRFARLQLRQADVAEDLVQEAIEAAWRKSASFAGQSSLKTWVFAILRHRIVDHLRQASRTVTMSSLVDDDDDWQENLATLFDDRGRWSMQSRQFWQVFETCLDHLPPATARVFMMREFLGFESEEICQQLGISIGNCHVILHRARLKLRTCLDAMWGRPSAA